jgi:hypothetical protein
MRIAPCIVAITTLTTLIACAPADKSCTKGVAKGDVLNVEIIEPWNEASAYKFDQDSDFDISGRTPPCAWKKDIRPGATFTIKLGDYALFGSPSCDDTLCPTDFPTPSESTSRGAGFPATAYLCGRNRRKVTLSGCEVSRFVGLYRTRTASDPFSEPKKGEVPPVVLTRAFAFAPKDFGGLVCSAPETVFPAEAKAPGDAGLYYPCADSWVVRVVKR